MLERIKTIFAPAPAEDVKSVDPVVAVLIPSRGSNVSEFTFDLAQMLALTSVSPPVVERRLEYVLKRKGGTYVDINRCELVQDAFKDPDVTHILWLDDDMGFPADTMLHLLSRNMPFVGANYSRRKFPLEHVAVKHVGPPGVKLVTNRESKGVEQCEAIGFGVCLIRRDVIESVEFPWFDQHWDKANRRWVGEDVDFCLRATAAGFPPFVDHDLSQQVTHHGIVAHTCDHANEYQRVRNEKLAQHKLDLAGLQD